MLRVLTECRFTSTVHVVALASDLIDNIFTTLMLLHDHVFQQRIDMTHRFTGGLAVERLKKFVQKSVQFAPQSTINMLAVDAGNKRR